MASYFLASDGFCGDYRSIGTQHKLFSYPVSYKFWDQNTTSGQKPPTRHLSVKLESQV